MQKVHKSFSELGDLYVESVVKQKLETVGTVKTGDDLGLKKAGKADEPVKKVKKDLDTPKEDKDNSSEEGATTDDAKEVGKKLPAGVKGGLPTANKKIAKESVSLFDRIAQKALGGSAPRQILENEEVKALTDGGLPAADTGAAEDGVEGEDVSEEVVDHKQIIGEIEALVAKLKAHFAKDEAEESADDSDFEIEDLAGEDEVRKESVAPTPAPDGVAARTAKDNKVSTTIKPATNAVAKVFVKNADGSLTELSDEEGKKLMDKNNKVGSGKVATVGASAFA